MLIWGSNAQLGGRRHKIVQRWVQELQRGNCLNVPPFNCADSSWERDNKQNLPNHLESLAPIIEPKVSQNYLPIRLDSHRKLNWTDNKLDSLIFVLRQHIILAINVTCRE